ncbi:MAG: hypothetical protein JNL87_00865 [Burkholderiaceae bacterium]|nr:hypothetical protein [Burkholderiaceae bacterium]
MNPTLTPLEAARIADDAEALAFADLFDAAPAPLRDTLGLRVERIADATLLLAPGLPTPMFNRAMGLGLVRPADESAVAAIADTYRGAGIGAWWLHWNPLAAPADLPARLAAQGYTPPARRSWAKMLHGREAPPAMPTGLGVAPARDDQIAAVTRAIARAFEMPPFMADWLAALHGRAGWRTYAVADGDEVVGGGCLFQTGHETGTLAWLGMGAVLPSHRRRGGQGALMARRIADAIADGALHVVTETGEAMAGEPNPSLGNMQRCGFVRVASRLNFAAPA